MADFKYIVMKTLKINSPDGYEIDKKQSTFENIVFKPLNKALPKKWEDLKDVEGYYIDKACKPRQMEEGLIIEENRNIFATKEQAEASIALAQLSQLIKMYNNGWIPDWTDSEDKCVIVFNDNEIQCEVYCFTQSFLALKTRELRDEFLDNFRDLILIAKPLL